jgi:hypothetical protein
VSKPRIYIDACPIIDLVKHRLQMQSEDDRQRDAWFTDRLIQAAKQQKVELFTSTLLPPATDGWSDITDLYKARYGEPKPGMAIWIRTCQHIDGWTDVPKVARARVPAAAA